MRNHRVLSMNRVMMILDHDWVDEPDCVRVYDWERNFVHNCEQDWEDRSDDQGYENYEVEKTSNRIVFGLQSSLRIRGS